MAGITYYLGAGLWKKHRKPPSNLPRQSTTAPRHCDERTMNEQASTCSRSSTLHVPVLPQLPEKILRLMDAAYAARGGAERMSLGQWHDVEEELKSRLEDEHEEHQQ